MIGAVLPGLALVACGTTHDQGLGSGSGSFVGGSGASADDGGCGLVCGAGSGGTGSSGSSYDGGPAIGTYTAPDCAGCSFPPLTGAPACAAGTPPIKVVYPPDTVLLPPNMNVISVQWTPYGAPFKMFEVDFQNASTDLRVITKCAAQVMDNGQPPMPAGGCELLVAPDVWASLANANRGGSAVSLTVRGTTDGACAAAAPPVQISFAQQDLLGTYYYWKSTVSSNGTGGQIWKKTFGDLSRPEANVTAGLTSTCNGCHVLARDGSRMVVYSDDDDSDDEYSDVGGSLLDLTVNPPATLAGSNQKGNGQPPGFSTLSPTAAYYLTSNGNAKAKPTNQFALYNGQTGALIGNTPAFGVDGDRPTMPDWSPDGKSVVYVLPTMVGASWRKDDDHVFSGSLYTLPYMGNQVFGAPTIFLKSNGENNYYPSYSPDVPSSFVLFDRAPLDMSAGALDGCIGTDPKRACPNDSFSNPAARLMLTAASAGKPVIDLEKANGSGAGSPLPLSNSYPKWAPFVQTYKGQKLLWFAFSSTRDYGIRVKNHKTGMYQCYPADSFELPGSSHHGSFAPECQQPQLWMAPIRLDEAFNGTTDPSGVAFWIPYQDPSTHNHTPQWTHQPDQPLPPASQCIPSGQSCLAHPNACCNGPGLPSLVCTGNGLCGQILN
ncbi:MAG: hypothetical protein M3O50_13225 [Myxococcota bacterium]|nr:hypothetical protein [Myxococcota bacterium]